MANHQINFQKIGKNVFLLNWYRIKLNRIKTLPEGFPLFIDLNKFTCYGYMLQII